jgi:Rps23 Pro-64 3,4-dihydroxylase Tpa1-like proline 4-hydroxylase
MKQYYTRPFLTKDECQYLIDYYNVQQPERIASDYKTKDGRILNRKQNVLSMTDSEEPYAFFSNKLKDVHQDICKNMGLTKNVIFNFQKRWFESQPELIHDHVNFDTFENKIKTYEVFLSKYGVGNYCAPHVDNTQIGRMFTEWYWQAHDVPRALWHKHPRLYIVSVILNDEFEGGRLRIAKSEETAQTDYVDVSPPAGHLVAMEATCCHEVTPVTAGARYSLISWAYLEHEGFYPLGCDKDIFNKEPVR